MLRRRSRLALVGTLVTALMTGLVAASALRPPTLEGLLLGSILASTDGAAIFALLRGSTLRRRLARTLEGGVRASTTPSRCCSSWASSTGSSSRTTASPTWPGCSSRRSRSAWRSAWLVGCAASGRSAGLRSPRAGLYPVASVAAAGWRSGRADILHGSGFLAVYLAGLALGSGADPGARHDHRLPRGPRVGRADRALPDARAAGLPDELGDVAVEGTLVALVVVLRRAAAGGVRRDGVRGLPARRAAVLGGPACAARSRSCSRPSRSSPGAPQPSSSSTSSSSRS